MPDNPDQPTLGPHGGKRIKGQRSDDVTLRSRGNSVVYITARLRRDGRADLVEAISSREMSAFSAAVLMGWTTRRRTVAVRDQAWRPATVDVKSLIA